MRIGLYPGTFDPLTLGHIDIIGRAANLVDRLIIGVAKNEAKKPLFSVTERCEIIEQEVGQMSKVSDCMFDVRPFDDLLIRFAEQTGSSMIIRGLRAVQDFEYEFQMTAMNDKLNPAIETVFLMADVSQQATASRLVKEIARLDGDVSHFVTSNVERRLREKFNSK